MASWLAILANNPATATIAAILGGLLLLASIKLKSRREDVRGWLGLEEQRDRLYSDIVNERNDWRRNCQYCNQRLLRASIWSAGAAGELGRTASGRGWLESNPMPDPNETLSPFIPPTTQYQSPPETGEEKEKES